MNDLNTDPREAPAPEDTPPDGAKAFHFASDMEDDVQHLKNLACAIRLIAQSDGVDKQTQDALHGIAEAMGEPLQSIQEAREQIFSLTWGYAFGNTVEGVQQ